MVAIIFPCAIIFSDDNPIGGFAALALQASVIGWIPAVLWAWKILHRTPEVEAEVITPASPTSKSKAGSGKKEG